jgi:hypothetical protein
LPFILLHKESSEIYSCTLKNSYDLPYHGTKFWNLKENADEELVAFLSERSMNSAEWSLIEVEEEQLKMFNVKLKNDSRYHIYLVENGKTLAKKDSDH